MEIKRPKVGVGVEILRGNQVLLGKRKGTGFADSFYSSPGGHLEWGESFEECAKREIFEETGLEVTNIRFICLTNTTTQHMTTMLTLVWRLTGFQESQN